MINEYRYFMEKVEHTFLIDRELIQKDFGLIQNNIIVILGLTVGKGDGKGNAKGSGDGSGSGNGFGSGDGFGYGNGYSNECE